jgi:hypothetical protein
MRHRSAVKNGDRTTGEWYNLLFPQLWEASTSADRTSHASGCLEAEPQADALGEFVTQRSYQESN